MQQVLAKASGRATTHTTSFNKRLLPDALSVLLSAISAAILVGLLTPTQAFSQVGSTQVLQGKAAEPLLCNADESQAKFANFANTGKLESLFEVVLLPHLQANLSA